MSITRNLGFSLPSSVFLVAAFGAVGDGITDDTAAITNAISAGLADGGVVVLPPGTYNSNGQTVTLNGKRLKISGSGQSAELVSTATTSATDTSCLSIVGGNTIGGDWIEISDLQLKGSSTSGFGVDLSNVSQSALTNLRVNGFVAGSGWGVGLNMGTYTFSCVVTNPVITDCAYAAIMMQGSANANVILGGWLYNNPSGSFALRIFSSNGNRVIGTIFQGVANNQGGVELSGQNNSLIGCWLEDNDQAIYANEPDSIIDGCFFSGNGTDIAVQSGSSNLLVRNCHFATTPSITLAAGSTNTIFENCTGLALADIVDSSGGSFKLINNPGVNPVGSLGAVTMPASGTAYTNSFGVDATVYVEGGTVTGVAVGGTATGAIAGAFRVAAGQAITLTYSAAPTWVWLGD